MSKNKIIALKKPGEISEDPLTELLRIGSKRLSADAVEAELQELLSQYGAHRNDQEHLQVVRNDYLPERDSNGNRPVKIMVPKIRDNRRPRNQVQLDSFTALSEKNQESRRDIALAIPQRHFHGRLSRKENSTGLSFDLIFLKHQIRL